ncbi:MAG: AAA family ATPase, partial [Clostridia bacterium]|nr:AAA family ATPase [Clostridia bacterium]
MQEIRGVISDVVYTNEQNGYSIVEIETEGNLPMVVTGTMPFPGVGEQIEAKGSFVNHAVYGQQFKATQISRSYPQDMNSLYLFLASGSFKGIGLATARRIINAFGTESIQILENEHHRLSEIKGITPKQAMEIGEGFRKHTALRALTEFLATSGLEPALAMDLYRRYGQDALPKLLSNPYLLITLDLSHNFRAVDALAMKQGLTVAAPQRIDSALIFLLSDAGDNGHVALPREILQEKAVTLLGLSQEEVAAELANAISFFLIMEDRGLCYLPALYKAECHVAERLAALSRVHFKIPKGLTHLIEASEESLLVNYSEQQIHALRTAAEYGLMVLTGGPGTGKTTSIRGIIALLEQLGAEVALAAPTGRAAKRMSELCNREAKTIHRLLEVTVDGHGELIFNRNATNPLQADVVILDELSMVDLELMSSLLAALKESARLILVGD